MRQVPLPLSNSLMTRSELEPLSVDFCCEVSLGLVAYGRRLGRGL